jgi:hypothetical protein
VEWIVQTISLASNRLAGLEHSTEEWLKVVQDLESERVWEKIPPEKPYGSREAFFIAEFGRPEPELTAAKVKQQLGHKGAQPGNQNASKQQNEHSNATFVSRGSDYIRARLERDGRTELLARVDSGELSAHAAAIEAGFRNRTVQVIATVEGFARAISRHLSESEQQDLKERIGGST